MSRDGGPSAINLAKRAGRNAPIEVRETLLVAGLLAASATVAHGQHGPGHDVGTTAAWSVGAQAIGLVTHAAPSVQGRRLTEFYLAQPAGMGHVALMSGRLVFRSTVNLEGLTAERGELNTGIYGEGHVDRRHPHTYLHEAIAVASGSVQSVRGSLVVGKGYAPFGTDDPMARPFVKYPVNHHISQILERYIVAGGLRYRGMMLEAAAFNGDEPTSPGDAPSLSRVGDSWAARVTLLPARGVELQGSLAAVESPEDPAGDGLDQRKRSVSARYEHTLTDVTIYVLTEWARTDVYNVAQHAHRIGTVLVEASFSKSRLGVAMRFERTTRPEEERLADPFRAVFPNVDVQILGITRWSIFTTALQSRFPLGRFGAFSPFLEVQYLRATEEQRPTVFVPWEFYGARNIWLLSVGTRVHLGVVHRRMGRYLE